MKFCGIEIRIVKETDNEPSASKEMAVLEGPQTSRNRYIGPSIRTFRKPKITEMIIFPQPEGDDVWEAQALANLVAKIEKSFNYYGWVDICTVDDAVRRFNVPQNARSKKAYRLLHELHCVHFDKYLPGIMEQVPDLYTCIFTGGVFPKEPMAHERQPEGNTYENNL